MIYVSAITSFPEKEVAFIRRLKNRCGGLADRSCGRGIEEVQGLGETEVAVGVTAVEAVQWSVRFGPREPWNVPKEIRGDPVQISLGSGAGLKPGFIIAFQYLRHHS